MTEALICAQNWLRHTIFEFEVPELKELKQCEQIEIGRLFIICSLFPYFIKSANIILYIFSYLHNFLITL